MIPTARGIPVGGVTPGLTVVAPISVEELGQRTAGTSLSRLLFEAHAGFAGGSEKQYALFRHLRKLTEHPQKRGLPGSCRTNERGEPRLEQLLQHGSLLRAGALFKFALVGQGRHRLVQPAIHERAPVVRRHVRLALLPSPNLATDNLPALDEAINLVRRLARPYGDAMNYATERSLRRLENILAKRTRRLERSLAGAPDCPALRQHGVALARGLLEQVHDKCAHAARVRRVVDGAWGRYGKLAAYCFLRK